MLARLPIPAGPARHEILASYLTRLAALHTLPTRELWDQIAVPEPDAEPAVEGDGTVSRRAGRRRHIVVADRLATVTGRRTEHLAQALPELRRPAPDWAAWRHQPQPGCPRCDARHDGGRVSRLLPHHAYVCTRHRYWLGPPDAGQPPTPLDERLDDIVSAQHRHQRLIARHGPAATYDAVLTGFLICGHFWDDRQADTTRAWWVWTERAAVLIPPGTETTTFSASRLFAAVYPEAVALAGLIASPHWRHQANGDLEQQRNVLLEASHRVGRVVKDDDPSNNAIQHWMIFDSHHPPSRPDKTFPDTRWHGATRLKFSNRQSQQRTDRGAEWFQINRRGGSSILHHRHIRAVISRDWTTPMDGIAATIAATASMIDYGHRDRCNIPATETAE